MIIDTEKTNKVKVKEKEMANSNGNGNTLSSLISKKFMTVGGGVLSFYLVMANESCQAFFAQHPNAIYVAFPCMTVILGLYIFTQAKIDEWKLMNDKDNGTE